MSIDRSLYLSPSRANMFVEDRFQFIQSYVFGVQKPPSVAMQQGTRIHQLLYQVAKNPDKIRVYDNLRDWTEAMRKVESKEIDEFPIKVGTEQSIALEIQLMLPILFPEDNLKNIIAEEKIHSDKLKLTGIIDMALHSGVIDIKTTSGSVEANDYFRSANTRSLAIQKIIYDTIFSETGMAADTRFLLIQTRYPYKIRLASIAEPWIEDVKRFLFDKVKPEYEAAAEILTELFGNSWLRSVPKTKENYQKLIDSKIISGDLQTMNAAHWDVNSLDLMMGVAYER